MPIVLNIASGSDSMSKLRAHPMAAQVQVDGQHLTVLYPKGFRLDGVRVTLANGIAWSCAQALVRMEGEWLADLPLSLHPTRRTDRNERHAGTLPSR